MARHCVCWFDKKRPHKISRFANIDGSENLAPKIGHKNVYTKSNTSGLLSYFSKRRCKQILYSVGLIEVNFGKSFTGSVSEGCYCHAGGHWLNTAATKLC